jgi:hypothetical protein
MGNRLRFSGGLLIMGLSIFQLVGCCCDDCGERCMPEYCGGVELACFGYHSTCWHPWPEECPTCPPPTWSAPVTDLGTAPTPGIAPDAPSEPLPKPDSSETPTPPKVEDPKAEPEEPPKSEPPKVEPRKAEPSKSEEPALLPIKQVSNRPDSTTSAISQRPLAVQPPTSPAKIVGVRTHHQADSSGTLAGTSANFPVAHQNALPRPISSWMPPPVVVEVDSSEEISIRADRILRQEGPDPAARPFVNGSLQSQRFRLP